MDMFQESEMQCGINSDASEEFARLARLHERCLHIRLAAPPLNRRFGAGGFVDILSVIDWPCDAKIVCRKQGNQELAVICKQRTAGPRELDKPVYLHVRVESLTPDGVCPTGEADRPMGSNALVVGPKMLVPTPNLTDRDTPPFRADIRVPLWRETASKEVYGKLRVSVAGRFDRSAPKNWNASSVRTLILPVGLDLVPAVTQHSDAVAVTPRWEDNTANVERILAQIDETCDHAAQTVDMAESITIREFANACKNKIGLGTSQEILNEVSRIIDNIDIRPKDTILQLCNQLSVEVSR